MRAGSATGGWAQTEAIAALNVSGITVLAGIEVDIRADGSLDMDDESLAGRDWVMASIPPASTGRGRS